MPNIALALSGGGNRASIFNLGVLLYLADASKNREVTSIASVSGGAIANGAVAQSQIFNRCTGVEFRDAMRPFARRLARWGTLWAWWGTWVYLTAVVAGLAITLVVWIYPWSSLWLRVPTAILMMAVVWKLLLEQRGVICGQALAKTLFSPRAHPTLLSDVAGEDIDYVFCATELHAGEHVYFSGKFVCSYRFGWGKPADLPLHVAVQASAAFPGAFAPRVLSTRPHNFQNGRHSADWMLLLDGGVYDNMADQWPMGIRTRKARWPEQAASLKEPDEVIVVNACTNLPWGSVRRLFIPIVNELCSLMRVIDVLYDNTTTPRRRSLVAEFDRAFKAGNKPCGALITLEQTPFQVASYFAEATDDSLSNRTSRARAALAALGETQETWETVVQANCAVPTTFRSLGTDVVARLLYHAYVTAMMNLHVILEYPLLAIPEMDDFEKWLSDDATKATGDER